VLICTPSDDVGAHASPYTHERRAVERSRYRRRGQAGWEWRIADGRVRKLLHGIATMRAEQLKSGDRSVDDDGVFAGWDARNLAGCDLDLRGRDHFVRAIDPGNAPPHQLRGAQPGDHDEFERIRAVRTLNHETCFFLAALVRLGLE
jgi:hypothetical protein